MSWDHFADSGCMANFESMSKEEQDRYKNMGEQYLGYDKDRIEKPTPTLYSSTGKKVDELEYIVCDIVSGLKNGLSFEDLSDSDLSALEKYYGKDYITELEKEHNISIE